MVDFTLKRTWFAPGDKRRLNKIQTRSGMRLRAGTHLNMPDYLYPYLIGELPGGPGGAVILKEPVNPDAAEPDNLAEAMGVGPFDGEDPVFDPAAKDFSTMQQMERDADEQIKKNEAAKAAQRGEQEDDGKPKFEPSLQDDDDALPEGNPKAAAFAEALAAEEAEQADARVQRKSPARRRTTRKKG